MEGTSIKNHEDIVKWRWLKASIALAILVFIFWSSATVQEIFFNSTETIAYKVETNPLAGTAIFVLLAAFSAVLSIFSSIPLIPVAIVVFGSFTTLILLLSGWLLGSVFSYSVGMFADRAILRFLFSREKIDYFKNKLHAHSQFITVLIFRLAFPSEVTGYVLGILRYHFGKYMLAALLSELPFAVLAVYSGEAFLSGNFLTFGALIAAGGVIVYVLLNIFRKRFGKA